MTRESSELADPRVQRRDRVPPLALTRVRCSDHRVTSRDERAAADGRAVAYGRRSRESRSTRGRGVRPTCRAGTRTVRPNRNELVRVSTVAQRTQDCPTEAFSDRRGSARMRESSSCEVVASRIRKRFTGWPSVRRPMAARDDHPDVSILDDRGYRTTCTERPYRLEYSARTSVLGCDRESRHATACRPATDSPSTRSHGRCPRLEAVDHESDVFDAGLGPRRSG